MADPPLVLPAIVTRPVSSPAVGENNRADPRDSDPSSQISALTQRLGLLERENGILTQQMKQIESVTSLIVRNDEATRQSQAKLSMDLRMQSKSGDLLSADVDRRLRSIETKISQETEVLLSLQEKMLRSPGNQQEEGLSKHIVQQMKAVERLQAETAARGTLFDDDVADLKRALAQQQSEGSDWQDREKRKTELLYGEIVRMSEQMQESQKLWGNQHMQMEQRLKELEQSNFSNEKLMQQFDAREANHFAEGGQYAQGLASNLQHLSQEVARLQARCNLELAERKETSTHQQEWVQQLQSALQQTDRNFGERLTGALQQLMNSIADDRRTMAVRWEEEQQKALHRDASRAANENEARELISERFSALEKRVYEQTSTREQDQQSHDRWEEQQLHRLSSRIDEEVSTRQLENEKLAQQLRQNFSKLQNSTDQQVDGIQRQFNNLEEVVRAAVRARLVAEQKAKEKAESVHAMLGNAIEVVQAESRTARAKLSAQILSTSRTQAEALVVAVKERQHTMEIYTQSQNLIHEELQSRIIETETRVKQCDVAREVSEQQLRAELRHAVASLENSIAAFESRSSASESATEIAIDKIKSGADQGLVELAAALQQVIQLWASDSQAEICSLRDETATAFNELRASNSAISNQVSDVGGQLGREIGQVVIEREVERLLHGMVDCIADNADHCFAEWIGEEVREEKESRVSFEERVEYNAVASSAAHHAMQVASVMEEMILQVEHSTLLERVTQIEDKCSRAADGIMREGEMRIALQADVKRAESAVSELHIVSEVSLVMESLITSVVQQGVIDSVAETQIRGESARARIVESMSMFRDELDAQKTQSTDFRLRTDLQFSAMQGANTKNMLEWEESMGFVQTMNHSMMDGQTIDADVLNVRRGVF